MLEKIKFDINKIITVLSVIAIAFLTIIIFPIFDLDINNIDWISFIVLCLELVSAIILLIFSLKNKLDLKSISIPAIIFLASKVVSYFNTLYNNQKFGNVPMLVISIAIVVLWIINLSNKDVKNILLMLLLVVAIYNVLYIYNASIHSTVNLVMIISISLPLLNKGEEKNENEENSINQ